jgi:hypothetical protein
LAVPSDQLVPKLAGAPQALDAKDTLMRAGCPQSRLVQATLTPQQGQRGVILLYTTIGQLSPRPRKQAERGFGGRTQLGASWDCPSTSARTSVPTRPRTPGWRSAEKCLMDDGGALLG